MKNIVIFAFCFIFIVSLFGCNHSNGNTVPKDVQVSEFNKFPGQCEELDRNINKVSALKKGRVYRYKVVFEDSFFSPQKHVLAHEKDVAIATDMENQTTRIIILTDSLPTKQYLAAGHN